MENWLLQSEEALDDEAFDRPVIFAWDREQFEDAMRNQKIPIFKIPFLRSRLMGPKWMLRWALPGLLAGFGMFLQNFQLRIGTYYYVHRMVNYDLQRGFVNVTSDPSDHFSFGLETGDVSFGSLLDPVADSLGYQHVDIGMLDKLAALFPFLFFVAAASTDNLYSWTKTCGAFFFLAFFKGFFGWITVVPDSNGWEVCKERLESGSTTVEWYASERSLSDIFFVNPASRLCADMMYSGHTYFVTLFALALFENARLILAQSRVSAKPRIVVESIIALAAITQQTVEIYFVLRSRFHYTSDIVMALLLTYLFFTNVSIATFAAWWCRDPQWENEIQKLFRSGDTTGKKWIGAFGTAEGTLSLGCCCCSWSQQWVFNRTHLKRMLDAADESMNSRQEDDWDWNEQVRALVEMQYGMLPDASIHAFDSEEWMKWMQSRIRQMQSRIGHKKDAVQAMNYESATEAVQDAPAQLDMDDGGLLVEFEMSSTPSLGLALSSKQLGGGDSNCCIGVKAALEAGRTPCVTSRVTFDERRCGGYIPRWFIVWAFPAFLAGFGMFLQNFQLRVGTYYYVHRMTQYDLQRGFVNASGHTPSDDFSFGFNVTDVSFGSLSDPVASMFGYQEITIGVLDKLAILFPMFFVLVALASDNAYSWTKTLVVFFFLAFFKGLFSWITVVPDANGWEVCRERLHSNSIEWYAAEHTLSDILFMNPASRLCADMMYSGHTYFVTLFALAIFEFTRFTTASLEVEKKTRILVEIIVASAAVLQQGVEIYFVLKSRFHYTSDIVMALLMTYLLFTNGTIASFAVWWTQPGTHVEWSDKLAEVYNDKTWRNRWVRALRSQGVLSLGCWCGPGSQQWIFSRHGVDQVMKAAEESRRRSAIVGAPSYSVDGVTFGMNNNIRKRIIMLNGMLQCSP